MDNERHALDSLQNSFVILDDTAEVRRMLSNAIDMTKYFHGEPIPVEPKFRRRGQRKFHNR